MKAIVFAIVLAIAACGTARAQTANPWNTWTGEQKVNQGLKDAAIDNDQKYRDQVCPKQKLQAQQQDCASRLDALIERYRKQKTFLQAEIDAVALPDESRKIIIELISPVCNQMDKDAAEMARKATALYPQQQASTK